MRESGQENRTMMSTPARVSEIDENDGREGPAVSEIELAVKGVGTKEMFSPKTFLLYGKSPPFIGLLFMALRAPWLVPVPSSRSPLPRLASPSPLTSPQGGGFSRRIP